MIINLILMRLRIHTPTTKLVKIKLKMLGWKKILGNNHRRK